MSKRLPTTQPKRRRSAVLFEKMVADPTTALNSRILQKEIVIRRWLAHVDELLHEDIRQARADAVLAVRIARRMHRDRWQRRSFYNQCLLASCYAVLATTHRWNSDYRRARLYLERASTLVKKCYDQDVYADLQIRYAVLEFFSCADEYGKCSPQGLAEALRRIDIAIAYAQGAILAARARNFRAVILLKIERYEEAGRSAREGLALLQGEKSPFDLCAALSCIALSAIGENRLVFESLEQFEQSLPGRAPEIRARLFWTRALILARKRRTQGRAVRCLRQAQRRFIRLKLQAEAAAVSAEIVRLRPEDERIPDTLAELMTMLDPGPLRELVDRLRHARMVERVEVAEKLRRMIAGPTVLPAAELPTA